MPGRIWELHGHKEKQKEQSHGAQRHPGRGDWWQHMYQRIRVEKAPKIPKTCESEEALDDLSECDFKEMLWLW